VHLCPAAKQAGGDVAVLCHLEDDLAAAAAAASESSMSKVAAAALDRKATWF
jgi:hypothetical protein